MVDDSHSPAAYSQRMLERLQNAFDACDANLLYKMLARSAKATDRASSMNTNAPARDYFFFFFICTTPRSMVSPSLIWTSTSPFFHFVALPSIVTSCR